LPRELQDRLLRWIASAEEGPRFLAGLRGDADAGVRAGRLLPELHSAVSALAITVPPLRERPADIPRLVEALLPRAGVAADHAVASPSTDALDVLRSYRWPENVSELYRVLVSACSRAKGERIEAGDLPFHVRSSPLPTERPIALDSLLQEVERRLITVALRLAQNNKGRAADLLSMWRPRLLRRMESLGMNEE
jgi:DNA-binding NtrC family response regulator